MPSRDPDQPRQSFDTRAIHEGLDHRGDALPVIPPPYLTSTFESGNPAGYDYTRSGNPTFTNLESVLASLEGAKHATVFASGVSAITAIVSALKSGDRVLAEENIYGCTHRLFAHVFAKFGVSVTYVDFTDPQSLERIGKDRPALVWIESPTNPNLKVLDIAAIARASRDSGVALVVDNTFASSFNQRPVDLGATLSLLSTTKYTNGHSDALGGAVCTDDERWAERMVFAQKALGLHPSPFDAWLITRGARTAGVRMRQHSANALAFAQFLEGSVPTRWVRYPFLPSHPQHALAKRQMAGGSGIVTADFGLDLEATLRLCRGLRLFTLAESLGGIESLVCHPASMTHASMGVEVREAIGITDSLVRFSVGIEGVEDLIEDLRLALKQVGIDCRA